MAIPSIKELNTMADVKKFCMEMEMMEISYHFDDGAEDIHSNGKRLFTKKEALHMDNMVRKAIDICDANHTDIFHIAMLCAEIKWAKELTAKWYATMVMRGEFDGIFEELEAFCEDREYPAIEHIDALVPFLEKQINQPQVG